MRFPKLLYFKLFDAGSLFFFSLSTLLLPDSNVLEREIWSVCDDVCVRCCYRDYHHVGFSVFKLQEALFLC